MRIPILAGLVGILVACGEQGSAPAVETPSPSLQADNSAPSAAPSKPAPATVPTSQSGFGIETVRISYKQTGPGPVTATTTFWIEDFGAHAAMRKQYGPPSPERNDTYWNGETAFIKRSDRGSGVGLVKYHPDEMRASSMVTSSEPERAALGWTATGERTFAGKTCAAWKSEKLGREFCVWRGVNIQEITIGRAVEATEIVEGERIPDDLRALAN